MYILCNVTVQCSNYSTGKARARASHATLSRALTYSRPSRTVGSLGRRRTREVRPRRAASARLEVRGGPGREAMLREALDPANQSLRDALRLSFRVLQMVMVVLVVVFLFSGLKTIEPGQIGLRLQLGQLEEAALEPGAHLALPLEASQARSEPIRACSSPSPVRSPRSRRPLCRSRGARYTWALWTPSCDAGTA